MEEKIYKGRGNFSANQDEYENYIDFINYVFGFNGNNENFVKVLPKLYKNEYDPCWNSFIIKENGKFRGAVGAFPIKLNVMDIELNVMGIGNVAVHPFSRSRGYMRETMEMALNDMIEKNIDLSVLGGRRQRYNYFSYEKVGQSINFNVDRDNLRYKFASNIQSPIKFIEVSKDDKTNLDNIKKLLDSIPYHAVREYEKLYDTMVSWGSVPYAAYKDEKFVGYIILNNNNISEFRAISKEYITDMMIACFYINNPHDLTFTTSSFDIENIKCFSEISENCNISENEMFSVLNYKKVILAFLKLKATYQKLISSSIVLLIHGKAKDENLLIKVDGDIITVEDTKDICELELNHLEAMNLLFGNVSPLKVNLKPEVASWLPLPIYMYSVDNV